MKKRCKPWLTILLLGAIAGLPCLSVAQAIELAAHRIDSMQQRLLLLPGDTGKVKLLNHLATLYFTINPDSGLLVAQQSVRLAQKLNDSTGLAGAYRALGANYWEKNDFIRSQNYYWQSLKITERIRDSIGIAKSLHGISTNYHSQNDLLKEMEYLRKSLEIYRRIRNTDGELGCLANIAGFYETIKNYDSAIIYYSQSLAVCRQSSTERDVAYMSGKLGFMYAKKADYKQAQQLEENALRIFVKFDYATNIGITLSEIAEIQAMQHHFDTALLYYQKAISAYARLHDNYFARFKAKDMAEVGHLYLQIAKNRYSNRRSNLAKAAFLLHQAIDTCLKENELEGLRDAYQSLSEVQVLQGRFFDALRSYQLFISCKDSLNSAANDKEIARHELEYVYGKQKDSLSQVNELQRSDIKRIAQEKELSDLRLKQQWLYNLLVIAALCLIASLILFRYRTRQLKLKNELIKEKAEKQLKETEYQQRLNEVSFLALRSQMNPHFIFNALNTIQSYVYANDKKTASNYLSKFSELIRKILDGSSKETVSLQEEIELLQLYIDIEKARFGDELQTEFCVAPSLSTEDIIIPSMLLQPYVENAIKHGLLHKPGEKRLTITMSFSESGDAVDIVIDDNGIGRAKSAELKQKKDNHHSFAIAANEKRIDLLNRVFNRQAKIIITDKMQPDSQAAGTKVVIRIPIDLYEAGKYPFVIKQTNDV